MYIDGWAKRRDMALPQSPSKRLPLRARFSALATACLLLPLLTGCVTQRTLEAAKTHSTHPLIDRIDRIDKAVLKEHTLLIFAEGRLTNSPIKTQFTITVPLADVRIIPFPDSPHVWGYLHLPRDAIHAGWEPKIQSVDDGIVIPVGPSILNRPITFSENAKLLPNTTQTIYSLDPCRACSCTEMGFLYVDLTARQTYTDISFDQVEVQDAGHYANYCLLPLTIPLDVAATPVYLGMFVYWVASGAPM